jgi:glycerol-3-phosphate dehydrogenase
MKYDVAVVGAGVVGGMIARALSMRDIKTCVIEAASDIATGTSRANSGIVHAGYDAKPGSLKARFNVLGNAMIPTVAAELDVPYQNCGSFVVGFDDDDMAHLQELYDHAQINGVEALMLSGAQAREMEPALSGDIRAVLYAPTAGIICPFKLTIAAMENAAANGVEVFLDSPVSGLKFEDGVYTIAAGGKSIRARYVVNAAGVYADEISKMAGGEPFGIHPRKGQYVIFDTAMPAKVGTVIFGAPTKKGKGVLFAPTVYGNMLAGPTAEDQDDKADKSTTRSGIASVLSGAQRYVPSIEQRYAITTFSGLRAVPDAGDFVIGCGAPHFVNAAGIESPGLTSAPAIAEHVVELLQSIGLDAPGNPNAVRTRRAIEVFADATDARKKELIEKDARYAHIVCRCEYVTEAEIIESIHRPCGARTVDGVKMRAGAGMGRCHGGFCLPRVMDILARETGRAYEDITKGGGGSYILSGKTKKGVCS